MSSFRDTRWAGNFNDRELTEIEFAQAYMRDFQHGTDGHSRLSLIAKLADTLIATEIMSTLRTQYAMSLTEETTSD